ncbi:MAG: protein-L-isoaspartate(D-aspartate) O-methyltransferase [Oceanipulchritudo sp.]
MTSRSTEGNDGIDYATLRKRMVEEQLRARGISDETVLAAMGRVKREAFVPEEMRHLAYADGPLPIGEDQTISQPYVVAAMTEAVQPGDGKRILEIGTGSGYQTAVLAETGAEVYTVEFHEALAERARGQLEETGYRKVHYHVGNGRDGWPAEAPFDGILVTAAARELPEDLARQLREGGRMVIPVGHPEQELKVYTREAGDRLTSERLFPVRFVPLL